MRYVGWGYAGLKLFSVILEKWISSPAMALIELSTMDPSFFGSTPALTFTMGQMGNVCGAVTGAFMVIGLRYSKTRTGEDPQKMEGYALVRNFTKRFANLHGTIKCRDLIGVDLNTPEGIAEAKEKKLFETRCAAYVGDAVHLLEDILNG